MNDTKVAGGTVSAAGVLKYAGAIWIYERFRPDRSPGSVETGQPYWRACEQGHLPFQRITDPLLLDAIREDQQRGKDKHPGTAPPPNANGIDHHATGAEA